MKDNLQKTFGKQVEAATETATAQPAAQKAVPSGGQMDLFAAGWLNHCTWKQ